LGAVREKLIWLVLGLVILIQFCSPAFESLAPATRTTFTLDFGLGAASLGTLILAILLGVGVMTEASGGLLGIIKASCGHLYGWLFGRLVGAALILLVSTALFALGTGVAAHRQFSKERVELTELMEKEENGSMAQKYYADLIQKAEVAIRVTNVAKTYTLLWLRSAMIVSFIGLAAVVATSYTSAVMLGGMLILLSGVASLHATEGWRLVLGWILPNLAFYGLAVESLEPSMVLVCIGAALCFGYGLFYLVLVGLLLDKKLK
jgi:hypothetical protein